MHQYDLSLSHDRHFLRATVSGHRSSLQGEMAQEMQRCWEQILWAAQTHDLRCVLVTCSLTGWVSTPAVYATFEYLRNIWPATVAAAYVDLNPDTLHHNAFAGKLAEAAGMNLRIFARVDTAEAWLAMALAAP